MKLSKKIFSIKTKKKIIYFLLSDDWKTKTPWVHKGNNIKYIDFRSEISKKHNYSDIKLKYYYIGPFAILSGKRLENLNNVRKDIHES